MSVELEPVDIERLNADAVYARLLRLVDTAEGLGAGIEVRNGFIHDYVLRVKSILWQAISDKLTTVGDSLNPALAGANATIDPAVLDLSASSYGLSRYVASSATGAIAIRLDAQRIVLVPRGSLFTTEDGRQYTTEAAFAARLNVADLRSPTDRLLVQNENRWEFVIDAVAVSPGITGRAVVGEAVTPVSVAIPGLVSAYVKTSFSNGIDQESDAALIARMQRQLPAKALSTRASVAAFLTDFSTFPTWLDVSTIGFGDEEMVRGRRQGFCSGGTADIYIRPLDLPKSVTLKKQAQVISVSAGNKAVWRVMIGRDDAPGFYHLTRAEFPAGDTLRVESVERGYDIAPIAGQLVPRLGSATDAAFSRFQTAVVTLSSLPAEYEVGDLADVDLTVIAVPDIAEAQALVGDRAYRFVGGDTLVRAAVPVFVSVGVQIHAKPGTLLTGVNNIRVAIASYFNNAGFAGVLHTSRLSSLVHNFLPSGADVASVEVIMETIKPDGTRDRRRTTGHIETLNLPQVSTTARTCVFFCDPSNVVVTAYQENVPAAV